MIAILIAMIGLLGTVAVQQTVLNASVQANEAATAMRIAMQVMEQFRARRLRSKLDCTGPAIDEFASEVTASWRPAQYYNAMGRIKPAPDDTAYDLEYRYRVETWVSVNGGSTAQAGSPYNVSVRVGYMLGSVGYSANHPEGGHPKEVRLDLQRRKCH